MLFYLLRRLALLPLTLFCIILVNFIIINLAPGDPVSLTEQSAEGGLMKKSDAAVAFGSDTRYLQFREHYGLTLPILFNTWPWISLKNVELKLWQIEHRRYFPDREEMSVKDYDQLRIKFGDQARFIMPHLLMIIQHAKTNQAIRMLASKFFARGGYRQGDVSPTITFEQRVRNKKIADDNLLLMNLVIKSNDSEEEVSKKIAGMTSWYRQNEQFYDLDPPLRTKIGQFFVDTRFARYFKRVLTLDFGTLRNDSNKTVISEVSKRFKYSLTLSILPMVVTFFLCQFFGFVMAYCQKGIIDLSLNIFFLFLFALPVFVVGPFLIEKIALNHTFPFTQIPIPFSGFTSPEKIYSQMTSAQRLLDTLQHIALPLIAVFYGGFAAESRLSRTAILEVLRQDFVRTAYAKGVPRCTMLIKHVGRNAAITITTSLAGSLGVVLGGSLIIETLFEINGFGKFFYEAIINRDYNVIMFSALAGSFLTLLGYLIADILYTILDPRVTLD
ncbi:MAG: ABC transporter permease [Parachlamydiaceae bacterium]